MFPLNRSVFEVGRAAGCYPEPPRPHPMAVGPPNLYLYARHKRKRGGAAAPPLSIAW